MIDARAYLHSLIDQTRTTWDGRHENVILGIEGDNVRVGTKKAPAGELVPIDWVQEGLDQLESAGSAFVGAVLLSLPEAERWPDRAG